MKCKCGHTIEGHDYMKGACCACACPQFEPASPPPSATNAIECKHKWNLWSGLCDLCGVPHHSVAPPSARPAEQCAVWETCQTCRYTFNAAIRRGKCPHELLSATEQMCNICHLPAKFDGAYWRHKTDTPQEILLASFCDKYGYPIEIITAAPSSTEGEEKMTTNCKHCLDGVRRVLLTDQSWAHPFGEGNRAWCEPCTKPSASAADAGQPDANCVTLPDGDCVGVDCMHDAAPPAPASAARETGCTHTLSDRKTAVADGYCPQCMSKMLEELREQTGRLREELESQKRMTMSRYEEALQFSERAQAAEAERDKLKRELSEIRRKLSTVAGDVKQGISPMAQFAALATLIKAIAMEPTKGKRDGSRDS